MFCRAISEFVPKPGSVVCDENLLEERFKEDVRVKCLIDKHVRRCLSWGIRFGRQLLS